MIDSGRVIDQDVPIERMGIYLSIPLTATNVVGSIIAIFSIESVGRRKSMLISLPFIAIFLGLISISMYLTDSTDEGTKYTGSDMMMFAMILYFAVISIGFHSIAEAINSEVYPIHLIGTAQGISMAFNWIANFSMASVFLSVISNSTGIIYVFLLMSIIAVFSWFFVYYLVPETAGLQIYENVANVIEFDVNRETFEEDVEKLCTVMPTTA